MKNKKFDIEMHNKRNNCILVKDFSMMFYPEENVEHYITALFDYCTNNRIVKKTNKTYIERELIKDFSKVIPSQTKFIEMNPINKYTTCYTEKYGMLLMRFLNADFSNYKTAFNTFFFAYGFEYLKHDPSHDFALENNWCFDSQEKFINFIKHWYHYNKEYFLIYQETFRNCVNYIYNLNGDNRDKDIDILSKFKAFSLQDMNMRHLENNYLIEKKSEVDNNDVNNYNIQLSKLARMIEKNEIFIDKTIIYKANKGIWGICYKLLEDIVNRNAMPIKTCENDGMYFIPNYRIDEIYCDYKHIDGTTCREVGAKNKYAQKVQKDPAISAYNKVYQTKIMRTRRNPDNKELKEQFENFKLRGTALKNAYLSDRISLKQYNSLLEIVANDKTNNEIDKLLN